MCKNDIFFEKGLRNSFIFALKQIHLDLYT